MKLGYICKYTPVEMLSAMGFEMVRLLPEVASFPSADIALHPNICSYAKAVFEDSASAFERDPELSGIILTTCCDSIRRLYDALRKAFPDRFFYLLDVPRSSNDFAAELYLTEIEKLQSEVLSRFGDRYPSKSQNDELRVAASQRQAFSNDRVGRRDRVRADEVRYKTAFYREESLNETAVSLEPSSPASGEEENFDRDALQIGILGARANPAVYRILKERGVSVLFDMTCTGVPREIPFGEKKRDYAFRLLNQFPCMRMIKASGRRDALNAFSGRLDGILYHTVKFCDNFSFEYAELKKNLSIPLLSIETDSTRGSEGQIRTRMEAFLEEIAMRKGIKMTARPLEAENKRYVLGIDSGSTSTNAVILDRDQRIVAFEVLRTGAKSMESAEKALTNVLSKAGLKRNDLFRIISTGYGRVSIDFADENVTEISCHGKGAHYFNPKVRTILDIGGQDSKAIRINENGEVIDFVMNDKCAAGTGRFLEAMARTLEIPVEELGPISLGSGENVPISSMCTVFAESEVISLIAQNKETADIAMGVHRAIAGKAIGLLRKVGIEGCIMMTGGVAKNPGVRKALEEELGSSLFIPKEPEIVGAVGAALYGLN